MSDRTPHKILVVDDESTIRRTLAVLLSRHGYAVQTAADGREAIMLLEEGGYALVITDVAMPGVGGIELLSVIRRLRLPLQAMVMTAYGAEDVAIAAIREGAVDYFRKPLDLRKVVGRVAEVLAAGAKQGRREALVERLRQERKTLSERLRQREEALRQLTGRYASHAKQVLLGEAAATLTHEINNPLHVIQGRLQLLRDERGDDRAVREHLDAVLPQISRLSRMARKVRQVGKEALSDAQALDLGESLREVAELLDFSYRLGGVSTEFDIAEDLPPVVADRDRMQQLWFNLLKNAYEAIEAAGRGRGRILAQVRKAEDGVCVTIADTGVGVGPDRIGVLQDPRPFSTDKSCGLGLGLCEARRIAAEHGGRWEVESQPGKGTAFRITFPAGEATDRVAGPAGRILVVEDEEAQGRQIVRFLSNLGYRAELAVGGMEGLERGLAHRFELVIFDVLMPVIDGPEVLRQLQEQWGPLEGIAITADPDYRGESHPVLRKPLRLESLGAEVERVLQPRPKLSAISR